MLPIVCRYLRKEGDTFSIKEIIVTQTLRPAATSSPQFLYAMFLKLYIIEYHPQSCYILWCSVLEVINAEA